MERPLAKMTIAQIACLAFQTGILTSNQVHQVMLLLQRYTRNAVDELALALLRDALKDGSVQVQDHGAEQQARLALAAVFKA